MTRPRTRAATSVIVRDVFTSFGKRENQNESPHVGLELNVLVYKFKTVYMEIEPLTTDATASFDIHVRRHAHTWLPLSAWPSNARER